MLKSESLPWLEAFKFFKSESLSLLEGFKCLYQSHCTGWGYLNVYTSVTALHWLEVLLEDFKRYFKKFSRGWTWRWTWGRGGGVLRGMY